MRPMSFSRRSLLLGGAAVVGVGLAAGAALNLRRPQAAVEAMVRRIFGSDNVAPADVRRFAEAYVERLSGLGLGGGLVEDLVAASYPMLSPGLERIPMPSLVEPLGSPYENAESAIATLFIKYSDYAVRAPGERASFTGFPQMQPFMCLNLQARYDEDD
jgi:hypothetical protein